MFDAQNLIQFEALRRIHARGFRGFGISRSPTNTISYKTNLKTIGMKLQ